MTTAGKNEIVLIFCQHEKGPFLGLLRVPATSASKKMNHHLQL
jgi:hypothetical protein